MITDKLNLLTKKPTKKRGTSFCLRQNDGQFSGDHIFDMSPEGGHDNMAYKSSTTITFMWSIVQSVATKTKVEYPAPAIDL